MAAISPDRTAMVASNIRTGMDWYDLSKASWIKSSTSLERQEKDFNIPLPVKFINKGCAVVMGTTKGYAVIFHAEHGRQVQTLDHANRTCLFLIRLESSMHLIFCRQNLGHCIGNSHILSFHQRFFSLPQGLPGNWSSKSDFGHR